MNGSEQGTAEGVDGLSKMYGGQDDSGVQEKDELDSLFKGLTKQCKASFPSRKSSVWQLATQTAILKSISWYSSDKGRSMSVEYDTLIVNCTVLSVERVDGFQYEGPFQRRQDEHEYFQCDEMDKVHAYYLVVVRIKVSGKVVGWVIPQSRTGTIGRGMHKPGEK